MSSRKETGAPGVPRSDSEQRHCLALSQRYELSV